MDTEQRKRRRELAPGQRGKKSKGKENIKPCPKQAMNSSKCLETTITLCCKELREPSFRSGFLLSPIIRNNLILSLSIYTCFRKMCSFFLQGMHVQSCFLWCHFLLEVIFILLYTNLCNPFSVPLHIKKGNGDNLLH